MPSSEAPTTAEPAPSDPLAQAQPQSQVKMVAPKSDNTQATTANTQNLSPAELKKQAKAEKAARRQQALAEKAGPVAPPVALPSPGLQQKSDPIKGAKVNHKRTGSTAMEVRGLPVRGAQKTTPVAPAEPKKEDKTVEFFRHLYKTRTTSIAGANKEVHPAVLALGLQMSNYTICGSCARLVATLQAFKRV